MIDRPAPTEQRAGVRPIAFALDNVGAVGRAVSLNIRPEDLTRNEPSRSAVHQTLAHGDVKGWVDNFGAGMPSLTISGHTGWRQALGTGMDGAQAFDALNQLVVHDYHDAKQSAIDYGIDPALVKLLFIDTLDNFAWSVVPTQFVLRRSKSRPLLWQYNITLQAVSTSVSASVKLGPGYGSPANGVIALDRTIGRLASYQPNVKSWVDEALGAVDGVFSGVSEAIAGFVLTTNSVLSAVLSVLRDSNNLATGVGNRLISVASSLASVGLNVFRVVSSIAGLPGDIRSKISNVAAAYNEALCIFANSLRPRKVYEQYTGLYGASNCSSTTGGRPYSPYANLNVFELMTPDKGPISVTSAARGSISTLVGMDPVLAPVPMGEIGRLTSVISGGVGVAT
jgi:hypothetical protein